MYVQIHTSFKNTNKFYWFYLQANRAYYLQLHPSKTLMAEKLIDVLASNNWTRVAVVVENSIESDGFLDALKMLKNKITLDFTIRIKLNENIGSSESMWVYVCLAYWESMM